MQFSIDKKTVVDMLTIGFNTVTVAAKGFHKHVMMHVIAILRTYWQDAIQSSSTRIVIVSMLHHSFLLQELSQHDANDISSVKT